MVQQLEKPLEQILEPDISHLITEDGTPLDNFCSEKQQRFLTSTLYSSKPTEIFLASANVGIYHNLGEPPIVPDVFLSLDVETPENWWEKAHRCYLVWQFGKVPEVAITESGGLRPIGLVVALVRSRRQHSVNWG